MSIHKCVGMHVPPHTQEDQRATSGVSLPFPQCRTWGWNSGLATSSFEQPYGPQKLPYGIQAY